MSYRKKNDNETWNQYLLKVFRENKGVNFMHFCDKYFACEKRTAEYKEGIQKEKEEKIENQNNKVEKKKDVKKTKFSKKPDRLKNKKKGFLF